LLWQMVALWNETVGIGLVRERNLLSLGASVAVAADGDLLGVVWVLGLWVVQVTFWGERASERETICILNE
jgi:hypothetical protein